MLKHYILSKIIHLYHRVNIGFFMKNVFTFWGIVFSLFSFATMFLSVDDCLDYLGCNSLKSKIMIFLLLIVIAFISGILFSLLWEKFINRTTFLSTDSGEIIIEYGDLKNLMFPDQNPRQSYTIVIPVNNYLNQVMKRWGNNSASLHGYWLENLYKKELKEKELQNYCTKQLKKDSIYEKGNHAYPIGTAILIDGNDFNLPNIKYMLVATCTLSDRQSTSEIPELLLGIQGIIKNYKDKCWKQPLYLPVISGGFANYNMGKSETELLKILCELWRFNASCIQSDIHIVVYSGKKKNIKIFNY